MKINFLTKNFFVMEYFPVLTNNKIKYYHFEFINQFNYKDPGIELDYKPETKELIYPEIFQYVIPELVHYYALLKLPEKVFYSAYFWIVDDQGNDLYAYHIHSNTGFKTLPWYKIFDIKVHLKNSHTIDRNMIIIDLLNKSHNIIFESINHYEQYQSLPVFVSTILNSFINEKDKLNEILQKLYHK